MAAQRASRTPLVVVNAATETEAALEQRVVHQAMTPVELQQSTGAKQLKQEEEVLQEVGGTRRSPEKVPASLRATVPAQQSKNSTQ